MASKKKEEEIVLDNVETTESLPKKKKKTSSSKSSKEKTSKETTEEIVEVPVEDKKAEKKKKEKPVKSKKKKTSKKELVEEETVEAKDNEAETFSELLEQTMPKRKRYTSRNTRRGRYRFAAWLGLVVILLAIIGMLALISAGIGVIRKANDHTDLTEELYDIAYPLIQYQPTSFANIEEADPAVLLQASIFRITEIERIRQLKEHAEESAYQQDKYGRMIISIDEINKSFETLYGTDIQPQHQTLGETGGKSYTYEYDKANACYYVPMSVTSSLYSTMHDGYRHSQGITSIRVGYAFTENLSTDNYGNTLAPTTKDVEYYQWYSFKENADGVWKIVSVSDT